jgi:hypothetical protein
MDFSFRGWIYDVAESDLYKDVKDVEQLQLYDFIEAMSYLRSKNKYMNLINEKSLKK